MNNEPQQYSQSQFGTGKYSYNNENFGGGGGYSQGDIRGNGGGGYPVSGKGPVKAVDLGYGGMGNQRAGGGNGYGNQGA